MRIHHIDGCIAAARLCHGLLTTELSAELVELSDNPWVDHPNHRDYQGGWNVLPLRTLEVHAQSHPILQAFALESPGKWQNLADLQRSPAILSLLRRLECPIKSARLMRLAAGAQIKPHRDRSLAMEYGEARLHLPLRTDPAVVFLVGGQAVPMREGELWYMNADLEHSVTNGSREERVHLVVDCEVNDWMSMAIKNGIHALHGPPLMS